MSTQDLAEQGAVAPVDRFTISRAMSDDEKIAQDTPYVALFREVILHAKKVGASDVHLQPTSRGIDVRMRVLGELELYKQLEVRHRQAFINEVKRVANLSLSVLGVPQDGSCHFEKWKLKLRASLLPSQYGEKIVFRLLDLAKKFDLSAQGFSVDEQGVLRAALERENGLILVSGPTGSGKTTTLYSLLCALDFEKKNVMTLEDPVEYEIAGLTQTQVSESLTFAQALRSTLRQDPDVILVGEIRDEETARLSMMAASTGHLVLSTLHANSAHDARRRMQSLGADEMDLQEVLRLSIAQRLVPQICPKCSVVATKEVMQRLSLLGEGWMLRGEGCRACRAGVVGLVPILEYVKNEWEEYEGSLRCTLQGSFLERAERGEVDVREVESFRSRRP